MPLKYWPKYTGMGWSCHCSSTCYRISQIFYLHVGLWVVVPETREIRIKRVSSSLLQWNSYLLPLDELTIFTRQWMKRKPLLKNWLRKIYKGSPPCPILLLNLKNQRTSNLKWAFFSNFLISEEHIASSQLSSTGGTPRAREALGLINIPS